MGIGGLGNGRRHFKKSRRGITYHIEGIITGGSVPAQIHTDSSESGSSAVCDVTQGILIAVWRISEGLGEKYAKNTGQSLIKSRRLPDMENKIVSAQRRNCQSAVQAVCGHTAYLSLEQERIGKQA